MGLETNDLDPNGPFTEDEASYINSRARLREVLRANDTLHLLEPENWVDENGDWVTPRPEPEDDNSGSDPNEDPTPNQSATPPPASDPQSNGEDENKGPVVEPFEEVDRKDWNKKDLQAEVKERNDKIAAFNEDIEDEAQHWSLLPKNGDKEELVAVLAQHDRFIYDRKVAAATTDDAADATNE